MIGNYQMRWVTKDANGEPLKAGVILGPTPNVTRLVARDDGHGFFHTEPTVTYAQLQYRVRIRHHNWTPWKDVEVDIE